MIEEYSYVYYQSNWSKENGLIKKKYDHRSLVIGEAVYHVAGPDYDGAEPEYVERWIDENSNFKKETKKLIDGRIESPEVFAVSDDYCNY